MRARRSVRLATALLALAGVHARHSPPAIAGSAPTRLAYGSGPSQFGELWLPQAGQSWPVVLLVHGGCWQRGYGLDLMNPLAADLRDQGVAVWNIEYRRLGEPGGGYPGTFGDVAAALDAIGGLATRYPLDLSRLIGVGHSAGGQLALWAAARRRLPTGSALRQPDPLSLAGVATLAGINDLAAYSATGPGCGGAATIAQLTGAFGRQGIDPFGDTSPRALLPIGVPQLIVSGSADGIVPPAFGRDYAKAAADSGDAVTETTLPGADHFALIDPSSDGWREVRARLRVLIDRR